jgi:bifunctional DNase/RNase
MSEAKMIEVALSRIVIRDGTDRQYIFLSEVGGARGFPIVIGNNEAGEIHRVVHGLDSKRPMTHQLAYEAIEALGGRIAGVDIVDLKENTFYAQLRLQSGDAPPSLVDARPSDAIALALRARCTIRVSEDVLARASDSTEKP